MGRGERWRSVKNYFTVQHTLHSLSHYCPIPVRAVGYLWRFLSSAFRSAMSPAEGLLSLRANVFFYNL
jgi:hypothetical protein